MSEHDDKVRGDYPAGPPHPEHNGLLPGESESPTLPADLAAVQADDALLDALSGPNPASEGPDTRLTQVLTAWRREIDTEPMVQLVDTDTAMAVVARAQRPESRRRSMLAPVAAAAAVLVIVCSGVGFGARAAGPGDRLWPLTKVLYSEHARSVEAEAEARAQLAAAVKAAQQGDPDEAQIALERAQQELREVNDEGSRAQLANEAEQLQKELGDRPGTGDPTSATSSSSSAPAGGQDPRSVERSTTSSQAEKPPAPSPSQPTSTVPESGPGTGGSGGDSATPATPRLAPPPRPAPPTESAPPPEPSAAN
ncbi:MAG: anti-sigma-D factor RsdA [Actinomycetota bacterium]|nr:anti-sigma-D factor RsdA [Actinomycetota bacterium]